MEAPSQLQPVAPVRPVAPYLGGKRNLASRLVEIIDRIPHDLYAEPFVGMGGIFFRRRRRPKKEVINDISTDVVNLFRLLQRHYQQLLDVLKWQVCSRAEFQRLAAMNPAHLTDLERAARFLFLQRAGFGGKGAHFGVRRSEPASFDLSKLVPMLEDVHERLCGVDIERLHYWDFLSRYDRQGALFYLDPPYYGCENDYGAGVFERADFERLARVLKSARGKFILSLNDRPEVRHTFADFHIAAVATTYTVGKRSRPAGGDAELLITNIAPADLPAG